jgi:hypothetical protein
MVPVYGAAIRQAADAVTYSDLFSLGDRNATRVKAFPRVFS